MPDLKNILADALAEKTRLSKRMAAGFTLDSVERRLFEVVSDILDTHRDYARLTRRGAFKPVRLLPIAMRKNDATDTNDDIEDADDDVMLTPAQVAQRLVDLEEQAKTATTPEEKKHIFELLSRHHAGLTLARLKGEVSEKALLGL